jgi:beta-fructofuranosidase
MLLAGIRKSADPIHYKGGTFIAYSDDGLKWDLDEKPFLLPQAYYTHECPDLFKIGDWWYLIFSEFTDKCVTRYVMSKSLDGPWITPINDTFDGHSFYAAKSISDGKRRILFGWNCIKNNEKDDEMWQWGGTIICNEIVQLPNGELGVKCPEEVKNTYSKPVQLKSEYSLGKTDILEDSITLGKTAQMSIQMFGKLPSKCKIEFKLQVDCINYGKNLR